VSHERLLAVHGKVGGAGGKPAQASRAPISARQGIPADVAYLAAARNPPPTAAFYRIDVRVEKRWRLDDSGAWLGLEVLNTTLHRALGKSCSAYVCREDTVGPLTIPSLGLDAMF
jgi:hypothetical protein